jgi:hypothetical protein
LARLFDVAPSVLDRAVAETKRRKREAENGGSFDVSTNPSARPTADPTASSVLAADAAASADFARFVATTNTNATAVEQLHADVARLSWHYVSHPLAELYAEISTLRRTAFDLLKGHQRPTESAELYVIAGRLCGLSAHVCLDVGDYDAAATQARTAWACADLVGHNGLRGWVRAAQSLIAFWNGDPLRAADLARAGQQFPAAGSIGARLASLEARSLAVAGDHEAAAAALVTAERAREHANGADEVQGMFAFPVAKQSTYAGTTYLAIGGPGHVRQEIRSAEAAVRLYREADDADQSVGDLFAAHIDLARGHMMAGSVDGTEAMLGFVLDAPPASRSASIARRLGDLAGELGAPEYRGSAHVAHLREQLTEAAMQPALPAAFPERGR